MDDTWTISTSLPDTEIKAFLGQYAPWRIDINFPGGIRASQFGTAQPFSEAVFRKIRTIEPHLPPSVLGGTVLDIGFNCGYNSIYLASNHDAKCVGIDVSQRHKEVATWLAVAANVKVAPEFILDSAETFSRPEGFDLVLHLGTLYHLPNPLLSLKNSAGNLRRGGWLALETTAYIGSADPNLNRFVWGFNGDKTNFWALSKGTLEACLGIYGMTNVKLIFESHPKIYKGDMSRAMYLAQKK
jgi:SAM-dependent methyltransferase